MANDNCAALRALEEVITTLTGQDGCPWDRAQTPLSLADYVIEESHELVAAIRDGDNASICGELGDVFFLLLFLCHLYEKNGAFSLSDVLTGNRAKMIRRHPHVFSGVQFANLEEQLKAWEEIKGSERASSGLFAELPASLPPLIKAYRIHSKAARVGFTWASDEEVEQQVEAEWLEWLEAEERQDKADMEHELGDMIFSLVELGRRHGIKASEALDFATSRFLKRFARMEEFAAQAGMQFRDMSLSEQDELWLRAKEEEQDGAD